MTKLLKLYSRKLVLYQAGILDLDRLMIHDGNVYLKGRVWYHECLGCFQSGKVSGKLGFKKLLDKLMKCV